MAKGAWPNNSVTPENEFKTHYSHAAKKHSSLWLQTSKLKQTIKHFEQLLGKIHYRYNTFIGKCY